MFYKQTLRLHGKMQPFRFEQETEIMNKMLSTLTQYADTILTKYRDPYHGTPLFFDGFDTFTGKPVTWRNVDGTEWEPSNIASQQNLFRFLVALSNLTGDAKYKLEAESAMASYIRRIPNPKGKYEKNLPGKETYLSHGSYMILANLGCVMAECLGTNQYDADCRMAIDTVMNQFFNPDLQVIFENVRPDGSFVCNDDAEGTRGTDPMVRAEMPSGEHQIWVGANREGEHPSYRLGFSELPNVMPASLIIEPPPAQH